MSRLKTWAQIVDQVEYSSYQPFKQKNQQEVIRKHLYRDILIDQISDKKTKNQLELSTQREQQIQDLQKKLAKEQEEINRSKMRKRQKQSLYRIENKNIAQLKSNNQYTLRNREKSYFNAHPENPFVALVDKQDRRNQEFKDHQFQQYQVNHVLEAEKRAKMLAKKQEEQRKGREQGQYVENSVKRRQKQRQQYVKKYLKTEGDDPRHHKRAYSNINMDTLDKQYLNYKIKSNRKGDDTMDMNSEKINQNLTKQSISPAYLGKIPQNYDRRRQLMIINKNLGLKTDALESHTLFQNNSQIVQTPNQHETLQIIKKTPTSTNSKKLNNQSLPTLQNPQRNTYTPQNSSYFKNYPRYNILTHQRQAK